MQWFFLALRRGVRNAILGGFADAQAAIEGNAQQRLDGDDLTIEGIGNVESSDPFLLPE